jgi:hypothetical protein
MSHPEPRPRGKYVLFLAVIAWMSAVGAGLYRMMIYETTPGPSAKAPVSWPAGSSIRRIPDVPNVLMAVHPRCPCTRGSLATLAGILGRSRAGSSIRLLVYRPAVSGGDWADSPSRALAAMPGVEMVDDPGGLEASRFGLATSGATVAFDAKGLKRFVGGLNATRGGREISDGGRALLAVLGGEGPRGAEAETFGCSLRALSTGGSPGWRR